MVENNNSEKEELIKRISGTYLSDPHRLNIINIRLRMIKEYIEIVEEHPSKFLMEITSGTMPSLILHEYMIQELVSFYDNAYSITSDKSVRPEYYDKILEFRNKIPAHADKKKKLKYGKDWIQLYQEVFIDIGLEKLFEDYVVAITKCESILKTDLIH